MPGRCPISRVRYPRFGQPSASAHIRCSARPAGCTGPSIRQILLSGALQAFRRPTRSPEGPERKFDHRIWLKSKLPLPYFESLAAMFYRTISVHSGLERSCCATHCSISVSWSARSAPQFSASITPDKIVAGVFKLHILSC